MVPVVSLASAAKLPGIANAELATINAVLASQDTARTAALAAHITRDHAIDATANKNGNWLFGNGLGYSLNVGNDRIFGDTPLTSNTGDDILIGDVGLIEQPMMTIAHTSTQAKPIADGLQNVFFKTVDRLYFGAMGCAQARAEAWGVQSKLAANAADWSSNGSTSAWRPNTADKCSLSAWSANSGYIVLSSDEMEGGLGNDLMFGDIAAIVPVIDSTGAQGMIQKMWSFARRRDWRNAHGHASLHRQLRSFWYASWCRINNRQSRLAIQTTPIASSAMKEMMSFSVCWAMTISRADLLRSSFRKERL